VAQNAHSQNVDTPNPPAVTVQNVAPKPKPTVAPINQDESKVPVYTLPDSLVKNDGTHITNARDWPARRAEILHLFEEHMYGKMPGRPVGMRFETTEVDTKALGGKATRKQVTVHFTREADGPKMDLLIYVPNNRKGRAPVFMGLNFVGNQSVYADPAVKITTRWLRNNKKFGVENHRATEASRGALAYRWQVDLLLERGYALVTACYSDLDPDFNDGFQNGVHPLFYKPGQKAPLPNEWGAIGAWAWGLSRALDYVETDKDLDAKHVAVTGHSRIGKAALWAGAQDQRFGIVISNNSGCGGAALSRRKFGETVHRINTDAPHWFCDNFNQYNGKEETLPFDQHELIALMAPRPVYVNSAQEDLWADPKGEYLAAFHATPVYQLLGKEGLKSAEMPEINQPIISSIGYHIRSGEHEVKRYDWEQWLNFADHHWGKPNAR
jgi:hypothetical protein